MTTYPLVGRPRAVPARTRRRRGPGRPSPYGRAPGPPLPLGPRPAASAPGLLDPGPRSAPWTVLSTAGDLITTGQLQQHIAASLGRAVAGFLIGATVGTALAVVAGVSRIGEALIDGPVQIKR